MAKRRNVGGAGSKVKVKPKTGRQRKPRKKVVRTVGGKQRRAAHATRGAPTQRLGPSAVKRTFPGLKGRDGCGAALVIVECAGGECDSVANKWDVPLTLEDTGGGGAVGRATRMLPRTCRALAAVGHVQRIKLMGKLLEGPATYQALQRVTKLQAGPLYHHINQLRLAGLILPKQRDLYELTRGGRNLILAAVVLGPLIRDPRRRPIPPKE